MARGPEKIFDKGDYATAAELWLQNAEKGDRSAICPMMVALELTHNTTKAEPWTSCNETTSKLDQTG